MATHRTRRSEREIVAALATQCRDSGLLTVESLRLHPCEIDLVALDPRSLTLAAFEFKRRDWPALFEQAARARLYAHYSTAILPEEMSSTLSPGEFMNLGIGLALYRESRTDVTFSVVCHPKRSQLTNRFLKRLVFREFATQIGDAVHV